MSCFYLCVVVIVLNVNINYISPRSRGKIEKMAKKSITLSWASQVLLEIIFHLYTYFAKWFFFQVVWLKYVCNPYLSHAWNICCSCRPPCYYRMTQQKTVKGKVVYYLGQSSSLLNSWDIIEMLWWYCLGDKMKKQWYVFRLGGSSLERDRYSMK
jgi:hypothetical protein